jgi:hypothetical protein
VNRIVAAPVQLAEPVANLVTALTREPRILTVPESGGVGMSSRTMRSNCLRHLRSTVRILEPTVLVVQGRGVARALSSIVQDEQAVWPSGELARAQIEGVPVILCPFAHPSAPSANLAWGDKLTRPYLVGTVEPVLLEARRLALARH